jgi:glycosyltransferase involved in cell wall biosynthesis
LDEEKIMKTKKITALIPCYNEAAGIRDVITAFPREQLARFGYVLEVLVIDNNSKDNTAKVARRAGARVIFEGKKGKGNAIRTGMASLTTDTDYVIMLDGDDTYSPKEILRLIEPIDSGFCNVVIGSRLGGRISAGSMKTFNMIGNWVYSHLVRYSYRVNVTDVLTGYFAWTKEVVDSLHPHLTSDGFAIEMEMITKMAKLGHEIYSVPISYHARAGESNLRPIYDGSRILAMYARNLFWNPEKTIVMTTDELPRAKRLAFGLGNQFELIFGEWTNRGGK